MTSPIQDKEPDVSLALVRAAAGGDLAAVKSLLASGADVNATNESGQTPLILAAVMGHGEVVVHLISAGADPRMRDRLDLTALEWSTRRGFSDVTQFLTRVSPPLRKPRAERETDSKTTEGDVQSSASATQEAEPASDDLAQATEITTPVSEQDASAELPAPEPEHVETSTSEVPSEPAALATDSSTLAPAVADSPDVVETESELEPAELAADSATALPEDEDSRALLADEPESEQTTNESAIVSDTPRPAVAESPALVADETESEQTTAESAVVSDIPLPTVAESPAIPANEAASPSGELESETATPIEPAAETKDPFVSTASTSNLESPDSEEAPVVPSWEPTLLDEEEETLTQRAVRPSVFEFTLPDEPSPAAASEIRKDPEPAIQMPPQRNRAAAFSGSTLGLSSTTSTTKEDEKEAKSSNLKRCPRCGAVYQNSPLSFCTRDNATLIPVNELHQLVTPAQTSATPIAVWLLIAFVLGASGFAAYRLTQRFYRQPEPAPAEVKPIETPPVVKKPAFSVGGDLAGSEVNIPEPEYPSDLITAGVSGPITVRVRVNKNGRVVSAATNSGDSRLRAAAVKAARLATFAPDKLAEMSPRGRAVAGTITYDFTALQTSPAATTSATATTSPAASTVPSPSASASPNADPNAPVVSNELMGAASNVPAPDYPTRAKRAGIGGAITVTIRVNRAGRVISWRSSAGDSQLRAAAIRAARKATFARERLPGTGDVVGTITYNFTP